MNTETPNIETPNIEAPNTDPSTDPNTDPSTDPSPTTVGEGGVAKPTVTIRDYLADGDLKAEIKDENAPKKRTRRSAAAESPEPELSERTLLEQAAGRKALQGRRG